MQPTGSQKPSFIYVYSILIFTFTIFSATLFKNVIRKRSSKNCYIISNQKKIKEKNLLNFIYFYFFSWWIYAKLWFSKTYIKNWLKC